MADVVIGLLVADRRSVLNRPSVSPVTSTSEVTIEDRILHLDWVELPEDTSGVSDPRAPTET